MAPPSGTLRVGRYFFALAAVLAVLYSIVAFSSRHSPKLGLDLVGGIRVIFTAQTPKGSPPPTQAQMTQARQILEDRINTTGVTGSTVVVQGSDQLVVEIPNGTSTDVARLGKAAILNFRGVVAPAVPVACVSRTAAQGGSSPASPTTSASPGSGGSPSHPVSRTSPTSSHSPGAEGYHALPDSKSATTHAKPKASTTPKGSSTPKASATPSASTPPATASSRPICSADPFNTPIRLSGAGTPPFGGKALFQYDPSLKKKMPTTETCPAPGLADSKCRAYSALSTTQQQEISTALSALDCASTQVEPDLPDHYYYACDDGKTYGTKIAYLLGFVVVPGHDIHSATAQAPTGQNGDLTWTVALTLNSAGADRWNAWTSKYNTTQNATVVEGQSGVCAAGSAVPCSTFVAFTLDGQVISAPITQAALSENTQISGNFTSSSARSLAQELNYGKLPVSFHPEQNQHVSATLGSTQLKAAFLAGGIGLVLVVIYSLLYYRGLGLVTIASLIVSAALTYAMLVILGEQMGFTLDLAGIAGFIVALGITADSFVVFFERLKDEVHDGRSARVAVPRAWVRARRTILSADTVSFLAAAILYYFASADVKGFAFTLGMSTILDLVVVFLFTHPMVSLLSRSRAFGSKRFTGLDAVRASGRSVVDEPDEPAPTASGARRPRRERRRAGSADAAGTSTAVLDEERVADEPAEPDIVEASDEGRAEAEPVADSDADIDADRERSRRRVAPQPGSAAERAAARRARLRQKSDEDGER